jgi:para-aminobenzoate synthetase/4-amino-4-deoxychorismate lyase
MTREGPFVLLDDARPGVERMRLFLEPERIIEVFEPADVRAALGEIGRAVEAGFYAAGYFSYELGYFLEPKLAPIAPQNRAVPLLWFGLFREPGTLLGKEPEKWLAENEQGRAYAGPLRFSEDRESYRTKFATVQEYIRAGDVYQINLTFPAMFSFLGDPLALYARMRPRSSAGHGAYIFDGTRDILSFSPELFFSIEKGTVTAQPMKGTAPRGADAATDCELRTGLAMSEKDRAENLMIVDLIRNDFGRLAEIGSVRTEGLFSVETYPTVHQMISTVKADFRPGVSVEALLGGVFPCGSVTGAPKIRAMEIIRELEPEPRGIYCGAIGCFAPDGTATFNVSIRTLTITGNEGVLGIGSGVVADSRAEDEYDECLLKAQYYSENRQAIGLIESMRFEPGEGILLRAYHLARLRSSAEALGISFDEIATTRAMDEAVAGETSPQRVRLTLSEDGVFDVSKTALQATAGEHVWTFVVSEHRLRGGDRLARHKTNWRLLYDSERASANASGIDEVLYLNDREELVEGSAANVFLRLGGKLRTPPLSVGALDGCLRRSLLAKGECEEANLTLSDLNRADEIYFGNSVRGLVRAEAAANHSAG